VKHETGNYAQRRHGPGSHEQRLAILRGEALSTGGHVTAKRTLGAAVGLLALVLSALVLAPTAAVAGGPDVASETYSDHTVECGYPIDISGEFTSAEMSRTRSPKDPTTFLDHQRLSFRETWTNTRSGEWFVLRGTSVNLDLKATQIDADVYEYSSVQAGQPFVIEDSAGRIVARDRGVLRVNVLFDTGGDDDPGREFVDFLGLTLGGPHPGFFTDICRYAADLIGIGSTSSQRYMVHPVGSTDSPLGYAEYLPPTYGQSASPLLVFLHGYGEGADGSAEGLSSLAGQAIPRYIANDGWPDERPFVVLAPQHEDTSQPDDYSQCDVPFPASCVMTTQHELGNPSPGSVCATPQEVHDFITYAVSAYDVDPARVYLTGLSCGGYGTWEYLGSYGDGQVAAAVPIAGEGRPAWQTAGCELASVPLWAFHGALDEEVDPNGSTVPVTGLRNECGVTDEDAGLTVYPDHDHDSWNTTYALGAPVDIYTWMLTHVAN
jgi:poly(3-hydroxybutyrate) depolymerase